MPSAGHVSTPSTKPGQPRRGVSIRRLWDQSGLTLEGQVAIPCAAVTGLEIVLLRWKGLCLCRGSDRRPWDTVQAGQVGRRSVRAFTILPASASPTSPTLFGDCHTGLGTLGVEPVGCHA